ncbi:hypothetical protein BOTCAL_0030g00380 [Botryotinia calthae]|uniref:Uncharacterized protein n=1 Tax=Botryotinia calthae TaxID=38488 RepID=A0A4Y8DDG3_9HELO|nr:hypothetical protein BOTCAL_0030g00380 [Botryotinia calthae]
MKLQSLNIQTVRSHEAIESLKITSPFALTPPEVTHPRGRILPDFQISRFPILATFRPRPNFHSPDIKYNIASTEAEIFPKLQKLKFVP